MSWYHENKFNIIKKQQKYDEKYNKIDPNKVLKYAKFMSENNLYIDKNRLLRMIENGEFNYES